MIVMNLLAAKAKKSLLNVAPADCGKSTATNAVAFALTGRSKRFTSLTLAGLIRLKDEFNYYNGHIVIDDLGAEKSLWSRTGRIDLLRENKILSDRGFYSSLRATITTLANLVYSHFVDKVTHSGRIQIEDFTGSVSMNIQPVLMNTLVQNDDWVAVVRSKVTRYYHLYRPIKPNRESPPIELEWGKPITQIRMPKYRGILWYRLVNIGLMQWGHSRVLEHIEDYLKACASLDGREKVNVTDYHILLKLFKPLQFEPYIIETYGFESGRVFGNNLYCILVELSSFGEPTLEQICIDYKVSRRTAQRLIKTVPEWCFTKHNSPTRIAPTERAAELLDLCGIGQKW